MKPKSIQLVLTIVLLLFSAGAQAGACSNPINLSSLGFSATYVSANPTNFTSATLTGDCTKSGNNQDTYTVWADAGSHSSLCGGSCAVSLAGDTINYFVSTSSTCNNTWNSANQLTFAFNTSGTAIKTYYGCIPTGQNLVPAGTYHDNSVNMTVTGGHTGSGTFPVTITILPTCAISSAPGTVDFQTYTAFGVAKQANTTFGATCTRLHSYTMSLAPTTGVKNGLNYSLALNTTQNSGGTTSLTQTGTGGAQPFFINGDMAAGQAGCAPGTCTLTDTPNHTLTISY